MRYLKLLAVVSALVAFPAAAFGAKPATPSQKTALLKAAGVSRAPARCLTARTSTANPSFAEVYFTGLWGTGRQRMPAGCGKYAANGVTILQHRAGHWHAVTSGSSFVTNSGACKVPRVPKAVVKEFRLCGSLSPQSARAAAAKMTAPSHATLDARITVHASGVKAGRYTLLLARELPTQGASPTVCSAPVGSASAHGDAVTISGKLPGRLACRSGEGPAEGHVSVRPGKYVLSLGILIPPAGFHPGSFVKRNIQLVN